MKGAGGLLSWAAIAAVASAEVKGTVAEPVIMADGLTKRHGGIAVIDGVSFEVGRGEIFGILGRNGAGRRPPSSACRACAAPAAAGCGCSAWTR